MDGKLTKTHVTSRPETIRPTAWSSMAKCNPKKAKPHGNIEKPTPAARQKRKITIFLLTKLKNLTPLFRTPKKKLEIPVETAMPRVTRVRIPTARRPRQNVAMSKESGRRPQALSEERLSLTDRERQNTAFESQRCTLHKERNLAHEDHVADRRFHSWHHYNLVPTPVRANQQKY